MFGSRATKRGLTERGVCSFAYVRGVGGSWVSVSVGGSTTTIPKRVQKLSRESRGFNVAAGHEAVVCGVGCVMMRCGALLHVRGSNSQKRVGAWHRNTEPCCVPVGVACQMGRSLRVTKAGSSADCKTSGAQMTRHKTKMAVSAATSVTKGSSAGRSASGTSMKRKNTKKVIATANAVAILRQYLHEYDTADGRSVMVTRVGVSAGRKTSETQMARQTTKRTTVAATNVTKGSSAGCSASGMQMKRVTASRTYARRAVDSVTARSRLACPAGESYPAQKDAEYDASLSTADLKASLQRQEDWLIEKYRLQNQEEYVEFCIDVGRLIIREMNAVGCATIIGLGTVKKGFHRARPLRTRTYRGRAWTVKPIVAGNHMSFKADRTTNQMISCGET